MKKSILLAAGGLLLIGATAVPSGADGTKSSEGELSSVVAAPAPSGTAAAAQPAPAAKPVKAAPAPRAVANAYPRCSATLRDRCIQGRGGATATAYRAVPQRRIQLASRAGERG
jgi:hypothetical protein